MSTLQDILNDPYASFTDAAVDGIASEATDPGKATVPAGTHEHRILRDDSARYRTQSNLLDEDEQLPSDVHCVDCDIFWDLNQVDGFQESVCNYRCRAHPVSGARFTSMPHIWKLESVRTEDCTAFVSLKCPHVKCHKVIVGEIQGATCPAGPHTDVQALLPTAPPSADSPSKSKTRVRKAPQPRYPAMRRSLRHIAPAPPPPQAGGSSISSHNAHGEDRKHRHVVDETIAYSMSNPTVRCTDIGCTAWADLRDIVGFDRGCWKLVSETASSPTYHQAQPFAFKPHSWRLTNVDNSGLLMKATLTCQYQCGQDVDCNLLFDEDVGDVATPSPPGDSEVGWGRYYNSS